jgi:hypothetical protein
LSCREPDEQSLGRSVGGLNLTGSSLPGVMACLTPNATVAFIKANELKKPISHAMAAKLMLSRQEHSISGKESSSILGTLGKLGLVQQLQT